MSSASAIRFSIQIIIPLLLLFVAGGVSAEAETPVDVQVEQESLLVDAVHRYGRKMNKAEAVTLEKDLEENPNDLSARAKLLGYYFYQGLKQEGAAATIKARRRHIMWLIRNHPDLRLGGLPEATIDPSGHAMADKSGYETASAMWRALAERDDAARHTLENAFNFLRLNDKAEAEKIAKRAKSPYLLAEIYAMGVLRVSMMNQNGFVLDIGSSKEDDRYAAHAVEALRATDDKGIIDIAAAILIMKGAMVQALCRKSGKTIEPKPVAFAGELLERCDDCQSKSLYYKIMGMMSTSPAEKQKMAQQELALLEKESSRRLPATAGQDSGLSLGQLSDRAKVAFRAGDYDKASDYANELLSKVKGHPLDGMDGQAVHTGHIVLGRIALQKGDVKTAGKHLLDAGDVKGGATLSSFGPNMALAKGLLEHGKRDVVIAYLKRCRRFWDMGQKSLTEWIDTIEKGGMPNFGPNLEY